MGVALVATLLAGCAKEGDDLSVGLLRSAVGEQVDTFPSWSERAIHVWINRARADPQADLASCTQCNEKACYDPAPPLAWSHNLARAARFHSRNLEASGCGMEHNSPCTITNTISEDFIPGPCQGEPQCACEEGQVTACGGGSKAGTRVSRFGTSYMGECIAPFSPDPTATFYLWLHEPFPSEECGYHGGPYGNTNGHRYSILNPDARSVGSGESSSFSTLDFGMGGSQEGLVSGVHYPRRGSSLELRANWNGTAPSQAWVNVDGQCHPMEVERGTAENGTYLATVSGLNGCQRYFFQFVQGGETNFFPSEGSLTVGCESDYEATRPPACDCDPDCTTRQCGNDGCGGSCGRCTGGMRCRSGQCSCPDNTEDCGGTCVDVSTDDAHCGRCDQGCGPDRMCVGGQCVEGCDPICEGRRCGGDGCGGSCGECSGAHQVCAEGGTCHCEEGTTECGGECVDLRTDMTNCGQCERVCTAFFESCVTGQCDNMGTSPDCDVACESRQCGDNTCGGSCGVCPEGEVCAGGGQCLCAEGQQRCGDECVDVRFSLAHCGTCGSPCNSSTEACLDGTCVPRPDGGMGPDGGIDAEGGQPRDGDTSAGETGQGAPSSMVGGGGCDCRATPAPADATLWMCLVALAALRRRP